MLRPACPLNKDDTKSPNDEKLRRIKTINLLDVHMKKHAYKKTEIPFKQNNKR